MSRRRVMILGATGSLGSALAAALAPLCEVVAPRPRGGHQVASRDAVTWLPMSCDATRFVTVEQALCAAEPDAVINCIAAIPGSPAARDERWNRILNVEFPHRLASLVQSSQTRLVHISTDAVFSGRSGPYCASDPPDPLDDYGRTKLAGEVTGPGVVTLRTTFIGWTSTGRGMVNWLLGARGRVQGYERYRFSPLTPRHLAEAIWRLVERPRALSGVFHCGGPSVSKHDLLVRLKERMNLDVAIDPAATPECDRTLVSDPFWAEVGMVAPAMEDLVDAVVADVPRRSLQVSGPHLGRGVAAAVRSYWPNRS